ncbi:glutathione S-transferase family protein, partial [Mesorhizobium sp. M00.F.Ca.ET.149.01.1.1]
IFTRADSAYAGRVTVPVHWEKNEQTIVSTESSLLNVSIQATPA